MANKLYNTDYLEQTAILLQEVKELSYAPFCTVKNGIISDVGCGVGIDAVNLAQRLKGNAVKVIGIDLDKQMIQKSIDSAEQTENLEFITADSEFLPFKDNHLSGIRNERLIQHLLNPDNAFDEFYRVLKPNAPIVIVETDWNSLSFYNGCFKLIRKIKKYFLKQIANNSFAATNLSYFLRVHGFRQIDLKIFPIISSSLNQAINLTRIDYILTKMKVDGYLSESEFRNFWGSLEKADREHYFICSANLILATALK